MPKTGSNSRKRGGKSKLSLRTGRRIQKWLSTGVFSVPQVTAMLEIEASRWTIWRAARKYEYLMWKHMWTTPVMTRLHKENRLNGAFNQVIHTNHDGTTAVLSHEKCSTWTGLMTIHTNNMACGRMKEFSQNASMVVNRSLFGAVLASTDGAQLPTWMVINITVATLTSWKGSCFP